MKTVVFCWELGRGNGHVGPFEPIARRFIEDGWRVVFIARDLSRVTRFFKTGEVDAYQAPFKTGQAGPNVRRPDTYSQMLLSLGFSTDDELDQLARAWKLLFGHISPDLIVFDHSPIAMVAARGIPVPQVTIGLGFFVPIDSEPMPCLAPWREMPSEIRLQHDRNLVDRINRVLSRGRQPELPRLGALYSETNANLFMTFPELDHFGPREDGQYFGSCGITRRAALPDPPTWPEGDGPRVYAYLKQMPVLKDLLLALSNRGVPTIAVLDGALTEKLRQFAGPNIVLCDRPIALDEVCRTSEAAITNAGNGTLCRLLRAGIRQLLVPLNVEQAIISEKVRQLTAGLVADRERPDVAVGQLNAILDGDAERSGALAFAGRYADWSEESATENAYAAIRAAC